MTLGDVSLNDLGASGDVGVHGVLGHIVVLDALGDALVP